MRLCSLHGLGGCRPPPGPARSDRRRPDVRLRAHRGESRQSPLSLPRQAPTPPTPQSTPNPNLRPLRVIAASEGIDGCPTFAKAYVGRKRRAQPNDRFSLLSPFGTHPTGKGRPKPPPFLPEP